MRLIDVDTLEWFRVTLSNGETCILIRKPHINELPTVDAEPVRHGEWLPIKMEMSFGTLNGVKCSLCGKEKVREGSNYCPNCGAKMDGGKENGK